VFGIALFGEWPAPLVIAGALVVIVAGLVLIWRERRPTPRIVASRPEPEAARVSGGAPAEAPGAQDDAA